MAASSRFAEVSDEEISKKYIKRNKAGEKHFKGKPAPSIEFNFNVRLLSTILLI